MTHTTTGESKMTKTEFETTEYKRGFNTCKQDVETKSVEFANTFADEIFNGKYSYSVSFCTGYQDYLTLNT